MPGSGSSLDRNDYQLIERLTRAVERQAVATEALVQQLEDDDGNE